MKSSLPKWEFTIIVGNLRFEMHRQPIQLPKVVVTGKESRKRKSQLNKFRRNLLGTSKNGMKSYIKNEEVIRFNDDKYGILRAWADEPLEIVNNSLGYHIYYVLEEFEMTDNYVKYNGYPHLIEKTATTYHDSIDWYDNHRMTYLGSFRHFLTTICKNFETTQGDTSKRITMFHFGDTMKHGVKATYGDTTYIENQGFYVLGLYYPLGETKTGRREFINTHKYLSESENPN